MTIAFLFSATSRNTWDTANIPRTTGRSGSSSYIASIPNVNRGMPVIPSRPIRAHRRPKQELKSPLSMPSLERPIIIARPIIVVKNSSQGPNRTAIRARGGAMHNSATEPTTPPMKALTVVIPIARSPSPRRVIG